MKHYNTNKHLQKRVARKVFTCFAFFLTVSVAAYTSKGHALKDSGSLPDLAEGLGSDGTLRTGQTGNWSSSSDNVDSQRGEQFATAWLALADKIHANPGKVSLREKVALIQHALQNDDLKGKNNQHASTALREALKDPVDLYFRKTDHKSQAMNEALARRVFANNHAENAQHIADSRLVTASTFMVGLETQTDNTDLSPLTVRTEFVRKNGPRESSLSSGALHSEARNIIGQKAYVPLPWSHVNDAVKAISDPKSSMYLHVKSMQDTHARANRR